MASWATDKKALIGYGTAAVVTLTGWIGTQLWASYDERGKRIGELEKRQSVTESKTETDHALLQEVRDDVKEILRRMADSRLSSSR